MVEMALKRNTAKKITSKVNKAKKRSSFKIKLKSSTKRAAKKSSPKKNSVPAFKKQSKEKLILEYRANARKLSRSILRRWHARIELEELDSLVDLALCEAAERYDHTKGASFMTFLFYHLRGTLVRAVDVAANLNTISAADFELDDLVSGVAASKEQMERGMVASADLADSVSNQEYLTPEEQLYKLEVANISNEACAKLDKLEQEVIYRLYVQEEQLVDIARSLGYSRCHISRVKKRALDVLHSQLSESLEMTGRPTDEDQEEYSQHRNLRKVVNRRKFAKDEESLSYDSPGAYEEHYFGMSA